MKRTASVSARFDVRDLAALLKGALDNGLLSTTANQGSDASVNLANVLRVAVATALSAVPEQRTYFEHSVAGAWQYLQGFGIALHQSPLYDAGTSGSLGGAQTALEAASGLSSEPQGPFFEDVLEALTAPTKAGHDDA